MKRIWFVLVFIALFCIVIIAQECEQKSYSIPIYTGMKNTNDSTISAVDVFIDASKTGVKSLGNNKYQFESLVRVQKENGGDDDASGVDGIILLPGDCDITSLSVKFRGDMLDTKIYNGQVHFCMDKLIACDSGIEIKVEFTKNLQKPSKISVGIGAFPRSPSDVFPSNNYWTWLEGAKQTLLISRERFKNFGGIIPRIHIPKICQISINCSGCGANKLCAGSIIDLRELSANRKARLEYKSLSGKIKKIKPQHGLIIVPDDYYSDDNSFLIFK